MWYEVFRFVRSRRTEGTRACARRHWPTTTGDECTPTVLRALYRAPCSLEHGHKLAPFFQRKHSGTYVEK